ncbi:MAG: universal stress protein [Acidobacteriota bacterium]
MINGPILTATDLTDDSRDALMQADQIAVDLRAQLVICHASPELLRARMLFPHWAQVDREAQARMDQSGREAVEWHVEQVVGRSPGQATIAVDAGTVHAVVLSQADAVNAGLIVLAPGSATDQVVRHARCPVLVARPSPAGPVLAATDFSDPSLPAVTMASQEAARRGVGLFVMHAVDVPLPAQAVAPAGLSFTVALEQLQQAADARLREALQQAGGSGEIIVAMGPAASAIVAEAKRLQASLIVIGTRGRSGLARLAMGSTAASVLQAATCSVMVVRLGEDDTTGA